MAAVGYSQGGIHAMNLSQDKAFLADYDLKYVLTAGSPVGAINPEPGVSSLHLEHRQDWVPGREGLPNPDTKERVTVTLKRTGHYAARSATPASAPGTGSATMQREPRAVSASRDPSLWPPPPRSPAVVGTAAPPR